MRWPYWARSPGVVHTGVIRIWCPCAPSTARSTATVTSRHPTPSPARPSSSTHGARVARPPPPAGHRSAWRRPRAGRRSPWPPAGEVCREVPARPWLTTHRPPQPPKKPMSLPGRATRKRRSRKRLARSQDVSDAIVQQWQAAPCRKSSGSRGVRMAHNGSDEHRRARDSAAGDDRRQPLGLAQRHEPAERAVAVGGRGADEQTGRRRTTLGRRARRRSAR